MNLNYSTKIIRILVNPADVINAAEFVVTFSATEHPGVESVHGGLIPLIDLGMSKTTPEATIAEAVMDFLEPQFDEIVGFHAGQISFKALIASSTSIDINPGDPAPEFPPLERLEFWLGAAEIGVSKAMVRAEIEAMPDGIDKNRALAFFEDATIYRREDPILNALIQSPAINLPAAQVDAMWKWMIAARTPDAA